MSYLRKSATLRGDLLTVFFVGLVLGTARSLSGSLYLCVGSHTVFNLVALIALRHRADLAHNHHDRQTKKPA